MNLYLQRAPKFVTRCPHDLSPADCKRLRRYEIRNLESRRQTRCTAGSTKWEAWNAVRGKSSPSSTELSLACCYSNFASRCFGFLFRWSL